MGSGKSPQYPAQAGPLIGAQTTQLQQALNLGGQLNRQFDPSGVVNPGANAANAQSADALAGGIGGQVGGVSDLFGLGLGQLGTQIQGNQVPDILAGIEARLRPSLERSFQAGEADIFESAARAGATRSSTTVDQLARFRTDLEAGLQSNLAGIEGALQQQNFGQQFAASQSALGLPGQVADFLRSGGQQQLGLFQFGTGLATGGGAGNTSALGAPTTVDTTFSDFLQVAAPIAMAALLGGCAGATAVYGHAPEVLLVAEWLETRAPRFVRQVYRRVSRQANPVIAKRPWLRRALRPAFDWVVRRMTPRG